MIGLIDSWDVEYNGTENEARFQLVCDSASELSSLTHYDSIKIRIGSECTDIATGDKYLKSSTAWVLQPSANQFENVYTKAQVDSMYSTLYQTMLYYHTTQTSTDGTITFYAFAGFVGSLTIYGNGQQTGTPTPDNPVMPEFVGVRTGNLFDEEAALIGYEIVNSFIQPNSNWFVSDFIPVEPGKKYIATNSGAPSLGYETKQSGSIRLSGSIISGITIPENIHFIRVNGQLSKISSVMLNPGDTALPYEPYGYKIPISCAGQTVPVYISEVPTVRRVRKLVLTGDEQWQLFAENIGAWQFYIHDISLGGVAQSSCMSNIAPYGATATTRERYDYGCYLVTEGNGVGFQMKGAKDTFTGITSWKSYLAAQYANGTPVTVWYVLAEPTTGIVNEPLAKIGDYADELHSEDAGVTIPTVNGSNTLTVGTDLAPSKIEISGER